MLTLVLVPNLTSPEWGKGVSQSSADVRRLGRHFRVLRGDSQGRRRFHARLITKPGQCVASLAVLLSLFAGGRGIQLTAWRRPIRRGQPREVNPPMAAPSARAAYLLASGAVGSPTWASRNRPPKSRLRPPSCHHVERLQLDRHPRRGARRGTAVCRKSRVVSSTRAAVQSRLLVDRMESCY